MRAMHAMPFGARLTGGGGCEFGLWAPAASQASLVLLDGADATVADAQAGQGGWWRIAVPHAGPGQHYRWQVDGGLRVPDPASRFNPEGPHGASVVVDPTAFEWDNDWRGRPWHEVVAYELHVGCFTPAGTYTAAEAHLPALAQLGVTAIQLMPLGAWPGRFGWGYDGVLPFAPHAAYGTPQELKHFIQAAHRLKLMVFVDVVYNHFGPDGNYLHAYAPQFFSQRHKTAWGAAINFDAEGADTVREFFIHNALYWAEEYRVDGLRFDAVHAMVDERRPDILQEMSARLREACAGRHVHLVLENDSNDADRLGPPGTPGRYDGQWNGDFHHTLHVRMTGERDGYYAEYDRPLDQLARVLTHGFAREGAPHVSRHGKPRQAAQSQVPLGSTVNFLHNHDQIGNRAFGERLPSLVADAGALRLATAMLLLGVATPMLFMGEEFMSATPFLYFADWQGELREAVRKGRTEEFSHFPRYAEAAARGEIPDPCSEATFRRCKLDWASVHSASHREWRRFCSELLLLRRNELMPLLPRLAGEGHASWRIGEDGLGVRWAFGDGRMLQMVANLGRLPIRLDGGAPPPLLRPSRLYGVGEAIGGETLGKHAAVWTWGWAA